MGEELKVITALQTTNQGSSVTNNPYSTGDIYTCNTNGDLTSSKDDGCIQAEIEDHEDPPLELTADFSDEENEVFLGKAGDEGQVIGDEEETKTDTPSTGGFIQNQPDHVPASAPRPDIHILSDSPNVTPVSHSTDNLRTTGLTDASTQLSPEDSGGKKDANYEAIMSKLETMNSKLLKLDNLESLTISLQEEISRGNVRIEEVSTRVSTVQADLAKYEQKWENTFQSLSGKISELEKCTKSWDKKLEQNRISTAKDLKIIQSGVDSNSKKSLNFEAFLKKSQKKWDSLHSLENNIKKAAEKKFQDLKKLILSETKEEMTEHFQEVSSVAVSPEQWKAITEDIRKAVLKDVQSARSPEVSLPEVQNAIADLRKEMLKEVRAVTPPEVTLQDLQKVKDDLTATIQSYNRDSIGDARAKRENPPERSSFDSLKERAFAKRLNIIVFGLADNNSADQDLKDVSSFFEKQMGLQGLNIQVTYRLGEYVLGALHPRPLVVKFTNMKDRWAVWNNKRKIPYDQSSPIRIQEDLPRKLREDIRVLQRIARKANSNQQKYGEVRVKDYKLNFKGTWYGIEDMKCLPPELHPQSVYSPRSSESVVFFTKHSPLSNHHPSQFTVDGMTFTCVEQYLALAKASLAENETLAKRAMDVKEPAGHKNILNLLRKDVQKKWAEQAPSIILPAIRAKFQQNDHLAQFLIDTYPLAIGEASRDTLWGVGMQLENKDVLDTGKWELNGNLLGNTLAQVRAELIDASTNLTAPNQACP